MCNKESLFKIAYAYEKKVQTAIILDWVQSNELRNLFSPLFVYFHNNIMEIFMSFTATTKEAALKKNEWKT